MTTPTEDQAPATPQSLVPYHWIMTLQGPAADGEVASCTVNGTGNLPSGSSRANAYRLAFREAQRIIREQPGNRFRGDPACVLFFSLEPDALS